MLKLLRSNIRSSLRLMAKEHPTIDEALIRISGNPHAEPTAWIVFALFKSAIQITPWFLRDDDGVIRSPQQPFFGFYALVSMLRSELLALRFYQAGNVLLERDFYAAAIAIHYTSAFQSLHALLASHGRVVVQPVLGPPHVIEEEGQVHGLHDELEGDPDLIVGLLTKQNKWIFEPRSRSHAVRWQELRQVHDLWKSDAPEFFIEFFRHLCSYRGELLVREEELVPQGLSRLAAGRHESIYEGFGYDPTAFDALMDQEPVAGAALGYRAEAYRDFAHGLLTYIAQNAIAVRDSIGDLADEVADELLASMFSRPFEIEPMKVEEAELDEALDESLTWVFRLQRRPHER